MKNSKEMQAILIAIYCINLTGNEDKDVTNLYEYGFTRCTDVNFRMIGLNLIKKSKDEIMPEVNQMLDGQTKYKKYLEEYKK